MPNLLTQPVLDRAIARGLDFLQERQRPCGGFAIYKSWDRAVEEFCVDDSSPFGTALIAYSLSFSDAPAARTMLDRATTLLLNEMSGPGVWRHWTRDHPYFDNIPPDLDDIACASVVLRLHGTPYPENRSLVLANRNRKGLFYTWLVPRLRPIGSAGYWRITLPQLLKPVRYMLYWLLMEARTSDVDGVVNANVLFYLGDIPEMRPVVRYLTGILQRGEEAICDKWYHDRFAFCYAVSRCCWAGVAGLEDARELIVRRVIAGLNGDEKYNVGPLHLALASCALMNCRASSAELERCLCRLIAAQREDGGWPAEFFYYGSSGPFPGYGSEEVTTGFCLEALARFRAQKLQ